MTRYSRHDNPYYEPEQFGLHIIGEVENTDEEYTFDYTVLWADSDGKLYWSWDAGCSCPSPFEDQTLESMTTGSLSEFESFARAKLPDSKDKCYNSAVEQLQNLLGKARQS